MITNKPLQFRNYKPTHLGLLPYYHQPTNVIGETEKLCQNIVNEARLHTKRITNGEGDLAELVPKKVNWDLKRDVEKKLRNLDEVYQSSINQIILKQQKKQKKKNKKKKHKK
ncbi:pre-mRNA-splicing factor cwf18 [Anaeramoeba flamelloides]|uniref:Pre-mRNA-splicing factor cwf18 n=1 Tax=Anaeramoeba flamelloides TaxID=1746091 RepID=A0ABQ8Y8S1_9EUKA|nr:pre-mRNA-splicing factor cwf18 [Anaeramoeba flamelloides]